MRNSRCSRRPVRALCQARPLAQYRPVKKTMPFRLQRRELLQSALIVAAGASLPRCARFQGSPPPPFPPDLPQSTPWPEANAILSATALPRFPNATFPVTDFGARGDGRSDDTGAFRDAIAEVAGSIPACSTNPNQR